VTEAVPRARAASPDPSAADRVRTPESTDAADGRRNFRLGVANGAIYQGGEGFIDSTTVIPVLVADLTRSNALIGLASALGDMGWLLPQVAIAPWASRRASQMPLYRRAAVVRSACLFVLTALAWPLRGHPGLLLALFFGIYGVYSIGAGFGGVAFMEIVGRTVPPRRLGSYFAQRMFWGGTFAALAGLVVRQVLRIDESGARMAILFGLAAIVCTVAYVAFSMIREPPTPPSPTPPGPVELLRLGARWFREEPVFRRLFMARSTLSVWLTASPFLTLFAVRDLGGGARAAGTLLTSRVMGYVAANALWHRLSRRVGNQAIMRVSAGLAGLVALAAAVVAWLSPWKLGVMTAPVSVVALEIVALFGGAAHSGLIVGYASMVIESAPVGQRQSFVSLMNTFLGPMMLLPMLGGFVVDLANAPLLFAVCALMSVAGYLAASRLPGRPSHHGGLASPVDQAAGPAS
jgi:MFS family permease